MKPAVRQLLKSLPSSDLADQVLHPENWTRDGHRITEIVGGTVYVTEPAGEVHGQERTMVPHGMGYSKDYMLFMLDSAIDRLTYDNGKNKYVRI